MDVKVVPPALRTRLGPEATVGLVELLERAHREMRDSVIVACTDRFERRLVEEISSVRVQMAQLGAELRQEMGAMKAELRLEMGAMKAELRLEMGAMKAELRQELGEMRTGLREEIAQMGAVLRGDMATGRVELFKWCFLFWIGQVLAVGGLMGVMLRIMR